VVVDVGVFDGWGVGVLVGSVEDEEEVEEEREREG
jgi:hypothetical protein